MAVSIPIFPTLPVGFPAKWSPNFKTTVGTSTSGREVRLNNQNLSLWQFELSFEVLRDQTQNDSPYAPLTGFTDYMQLCQQWLAMYGRFGLFYFSAPWDNSRANQPVGTGDGTTTGFVVSRSFGVSGAEITEFVGGLNVVTAVYLNGTPTSAYMVSGNAIIFATAPGSGVAITATFSFYYACHFIGDKQDFEEFFKNYWRVPSLKFRSVTLGGSGYVSDTGTNGPTPPPPPAVTPLVFMGCADVICTSPDGSSWTDTPYPDSGGGLSVAAYGNGTLVILSSFSSDAYYSSDGITWLHSTDIPALSDSQSWTSMAFGNGLFVAVAWGTTTGQIITSPDGNTWTFRSQDGGDGPLAAVSFVDGLFVAVSDNSQSSPGVYVDDYSQTSSDGITWTRHQPITHFTDPASFVQPYMGAGFSGVDPLFIAQFAASGGPPFHFTSFTTPDGITWTINGSTVTSITVWSRPAYRASSPLWVVVGDAASDAPVHAYPTDSNVTTFGGVLTSTDGVAWTTQQIPIGVWLDVVWFETAGLFVAAGNARPGNALRIATSPDGVTWTIQFPGIGVSMYEGSIGVSG